LLRDLIFKGMPHTPSHMEKEGGEKGLRTNINKGIANTNLPKKIHPSF
jgi:hypothetical protein